MDLAIWSILILAAGILFYVIVAGKMPEKGGGIAGLTAFHDMQPKDKQEAVEVIIDQNANKRRFDMTNEKPENGEEPEGRKEGNKQ
ncbi:MAG: hypothetical protein WB699_11030 [Bacteroidota bacterium]